MNFKHMPELDARWGYPLLWLILFSIGVALLLLFRRMKWL